MPPKNNTPQIKCIQPTLFFKRVPGGIERRVDVTLAVDGPLPALDLIFQSPDRQERFTLEALPSGESVHEVFLVDFNPAGEVEATLRMGGQLVDRQRLAWQPGRQWMVTLVPNSHHDLGYTDIPSNILREHDGFLDTILDLCDATDAFPKEARYHYSVEAAWSVLHYLAHRPPRQAKRLARRLRQGRIEVTALFGNETSELCSSEELARLLYPSFRLQQKYQVPVQTAELNDIPGVTWGLASVLAAAGVRYFAPAIPDYFAWGKRMRFLWDEARVLPRDLPGAFWWEGPDGAKVLFWYGGGAITPFYLWDSEQAERDLPAFLESLAERGYPYDLYCALVQSGMRDNSPPDVRFSYMAREWNERWAYPRLVVGTNTQFLTQFERKAGASLRTLRGDIPGTDYPLAAACTARETGINRDTHSVLAAAERWAAATAALLAPPVGAATPDVQPASKEQSTPEGQSIFDGLEYAYPAETLREAWDQLLLFDEHTWGMAHPIGPAQEANWSQKAQTAHRAAALAHDVLSKSTNRLADALNLAAPDYHIVVFNPLAWSRSDVATVQALPTSPAGKPMHLETRGAGRPAEWVNGNALGRGLVSLPAGLLEEPFELVDLSTGKPVPCQVMTLTDPLAPRPEAAGRYGLGNSDDSSAGELNYSRSQVKDLVFQADDVPGLGYKTFRIVPTGRESDLLTTHPHPPGSVSVGEDWLENDFYRLQIDRRSGRIVSLVDKELELELVDQAAAVGLNQLLVRDPHTGQIEPARITSLEQGEPGPLVGSLVLHGEARGCVRLVQEISLFAYTKSVAFSNRFLKDSTPVIEHLFAFPFALERPDFRYETSAGVIRPVLDQLPGTNTSTYTVQSWVQVSNRQAAITWNSQAAPVVSFSRPWSNPTSQAHHGATPPDFGHAFAGSPEAFDKAHIFSWAAVSNYRTNFQPVQPADLLFRYSLTSQAPAVYGNPATDPATVNLSSIAFGYSAVNPLWGVITHGGQPGRLPVSAGFCAIDQPGVVLTALKMAEDGDGLILRLQELAGQKTSTLVTLPFIEIVQCFQTDLVERNQDQITAEEHSIRVNLPAYGLVTLRCRTTRSEWPSAKTWWYD